MNDRKNIYQMNLWGIHELQQDGFSRSMGKQDQNQAAALQALMDCKTLTEAAYKAGISRRSLYNYTLHNIDFAIAYRNMTEEAATAAAEAVDAKALVALSTVEEIMLDKNQPGEIRLKAAELILEEHNKKREKIDNSISQI